jgi:D-alanyl-D-alanine carboxypeptidase (penicillin-binding protein 5/6)
MIRRSFLGVLMLLSTSLMAESTDSATSSSSLLATLNIDTKAEQALLIDHYTGTILLEKNADAPMYPSSMTKIMTAYMIFERLKKGVITLEQPMTVSKKAWKTEGSKMFIEVNSQVSVNDLLHGLIIQSGNDACVALAEGVSGSEEVFAAEMTERARALGATNTTFKNSHGLTDPDHKTTARDLLQIARHVIDDYPEYYTLFGKQEYTYNNINQQNRNPLLYKNIGCDGLKTGFTEAGKYGLVASAKEIDSNGNEKRFDLVINGLPSNNIRAQEATKLMTWAMRNFASLVIYKKGQIVEEAALVSAGEENTVPLVSAVDCRITVPLVAKGDVKVTLNYDHSLQAPLSKDQVVGTIVVTAPTLKQPLEYPLIVEKDVAKAGIFRRIKNSISHLIGLRS